jgi:hypothetical protein
MRIKILTGLCAFFISGVTFANCPSSLNAEQMRECNTIEGASSDYQDWQKGVRTASSTEEPEEEPDCD